MYTLEIEEQKLDLIQIEKIKDFFKSLNLKFELKKDKPYNSEFVNQILKGDLEIQENKGKKITMEDINSLWK